MLTELTTGYYEFYMLVPGLSLLIWIIPNPFQRQLARAMAIVSIFVLYLWTAWALAINYGVEIL